MHWPHNGRMAEERTLSTSAERIGVRPSVRQLCGSVEAPRRSVYFNDVSLCFNLVDERGAIAVPTATVARPDWTGLGLPAQRSSSRRARGLAREGCDRRAGAVAIKHAEAMECRRLVEALVPPGGRQAFRGARFGAQLSQRAFGGRVGRLRVLQFGSPVLVTSGADVSRLTTRTGASGSTRICDPSGRSKVGCPPRTAHSNQSSIS